MKNFGIKSQMVVFLACFGLCLAFWEHDLKLLLALFMGAVSCAAVDALFTYIKAKKPEITSSSLITGLIIGFVLSGGRPLWAISLASFIAITSKYIVNFKGRHVYNPAALGIFAVIVFLGVPTQWLGTYYWQVLVPAGLYFSYRIRKLEIVLGYFAASFVLFGIQALMRNASLLHVFGYFSYFYVFVMAIEPKTTPANLLGKIIFGVMLASIIFVLTGAGVGFDVELAGLLIMNSATPLLNKFNIAKKGG